MTLEKSQTVLTLQSNLDLGMLDLILALKIGTLGLILQFGTLMQKRTAWLSTLE